MITGKTTVDMCWMNAMIMTVLDTRSRDPPAVADLLLLILMGLAKIVRRSGMELVLMH